MAAKSAVAQSRHSIRSQYLCVPSSRWSFGTGSLHVVRLELPQGLPWRRRKWTQATAGHRDLLSGFDRGLQLQIPCMASAEGLASPVGRESSDDSGDA